MGLIQKAVEAAGIPSVSISIVKEITLQVRPPRAVFLHWPLGHPLGEPGRRAQHRRVLLDAFTLLEEADAPGALAEPGYRWKRHDFGEGAPPPRSDGGAGAEGEDDSARGVRDKKKYK